MNFYVWNKKDSIMGLSAQTLFASRPDFNYDDVIVIYKQDDRNDVVMMDTASELRMAYDIDSTDPKVIGFVVAVILTEEDKETIKEYLKKLDKENELNSEDDAMVEEYAKLLDDLLMKEMDERFEFSFDKFEEEQCIPLSGSYTDPECKIIDLSDVREDIPDKRLFLVLKHAFVTESTDILALKCMESFNEQIKELEEKREKHVHESNLEAAELATHQIETMKMDIMDSCDATLKIAVNKIYQYENVVFAECTNGQTIIIDQEVMSSLRTSAIEYEKNDNGHKYRVHYKTVDVVLNECYNEVIERGETVFIVSI